METVRSARAETPAAKKSSKLYKKQFVQYEPELVEEFANKKSDKQSVSGRLLTLLYNRLLFWSRYAKHLHKGRRYFWKSIKELSQEICYSTKQVGRGLDALEELGMIKREKLNKHNWKHTYYYYLPKSVHTAEPEPLTETRTNGSRGTELSSRSTSGPSEDTSGQTRTRTTQENQNVSSKTTRSAPVGTQLSSSGITGSGGGSGQEQLVQPFRRERSGQNVPFISKENNPLLINQLQTIVEKCLDYSINPPKPLTRRGVGFAT